MNRPLSITGFKSHGMVLLILILAGSVIASCSAQWHQFHEHQPLTQYEYILNGKKYFFATEKSTYREVIRQVGTPDQLNLSTRLGENRDGTKFIIYRTIDDDPAHIFHQQGSTGDVEKSSENKPETVLIKDVKFQFDREERLVSAELLDKSNDSDALAEWERRRHEADQRK